MDFYGLFSITILFIVKPQVLGEYTTRVDQYIASCLELFNPEIVQVGCCKMMEILAKNMGKCRADLNSYWSCADSKCLLGMYGLLDDEAKSVNETLVEEALKHLEQSYNFKDNTNFVRRVRNICLQGKFEGYIPDDDCSPLKYQVCVFANGLVYVNTWKDSEACALQQKLAQKCKKVLDFLDQGGDIHDTVQIYDKQSPSGESRNIRAP